MNAILRVLRRKRKHSKANYTSRNMSLDGNPQTSTVQHYLVHDRQDVVNNDYGQGEEDKHY